MKLSALEHLDAFALLGPGFTQGARFTLLTGLRATHSGPSLVYLPFEAPSTEPQAFVGRREVIDVAVDCPTHPLDATLDTTRYSTAVTSIREAIAAGDVYQVCYTLRARLGNVTGAEIFAAMCRNSVARFAAWVRLPSGVEFVSSSPELFFETRDRHIRTEPMKGTGPLGAAAFLASDEKNHAELAMITDLLRNDLTQVCRPRSVHVACEKRTLELPYAVQMVSDIVGELQDEATPLDALAALHPGGSVTGAPKEAALTMIRQLETEPRQAYTGALGLLSGADSRFSLLIRTAVRTSAGWIYGVGSGIVYDSSPEAELAELHTKLGAICRFSDQNNAT